MVGYDFRHLLTEPLRRARDYDHFALQIHWTLRDYFNCRGYARPRSR